MPGSCEGFRVQVPGIHGTVGRILPYVEKGLNADEKRLIFMDMVNKQLPTARTRQKPFTSSGASAFGSLSMVSAESPWNDIEPIDNSIKYKGIEAAGRPEHLNDYLEAYTAITSSRSTGTE